MSLTNFQRNICQLIAANRIASGESYVAGGVALNQMIGASRFSTDIDLFHDTQEALNASWLADTALLQEKGFELRVRVQYPSFIETIVKLDEEKMILQWARDSAYRFFPLQEHPIFGLTLHPFDLATNKTLALVGRLEPRDWVDMISSHNAIQPLGYLAWSASGKDPGLSLLLFWKKLRAQLATPKLKLTPCHLKVRLHPLLNFHKDGREYCMRLVKL